MRTSAVLLLALGCDALSATSRVATLRPRASRVSRTGTPSMAVFVPPSLLMAGSSFTPANYVFSLTLPTSSAAVSFSTTAVLAWGLILSQCFLDGGLLSGAIDDLIGNLRDGGKATGVERIKIGQYQVLYQVAFLFFFVTGAARAGDDGFGWEFIGLGGLLDLLGIVLLGLA